MRNTEEHFSVNEEVDVRILEAHGVLPFPPTASFICSKADTCCTEIPNSRKNWRHHFNKYHKLEPSLVTNLWLAAAKLSNSFRRIIPFARSTRKGGGNFRWLPKIDGLPIYYCKECPFCSRLLWSDSTVRRHCFKKHNGISRKDVDKRCEVPCQSLHRHRADGSPFRVLIHGNSLGEELASYNPGYVDEASLVPSTDRERSPFVSLARCLSLLSSHGLTLEDAAGLIRIPSSFAEVCLAEQTAYVDLLLAAVPLFKGGKGLEYISKCLCFAFHCFRYLDPHCP